MPTFKDNFSTQADIYAKYRPHYPQELYEYLASLTTSHELAWDCGTGNGQAAIGLAEFYDKVIATDPSVAQISNAYLNEKVQYRCEKAEQTTISNLSADIVTIANALHWFDFDAFYTEVRRVLKPKGVIVAWAYGTPSVSPEVDVILAHFHDVVLNDYWVAENRLVEKGYSTIPFPFHQISTPTFSCKKMMHLNNLISYLNTWSAVQRYIKMNKANPTDALVHAFAPVWGDKDMPREVRWKLVMKAGRVQDVP